VLAEVDREESLTSAKYRASKRKREGVAVERQAAGVSEADATVNEVTMAEGTEAEA
jgi:hypothetical protein